jgi:hypothetical protein
VAVPVSPEPFCAERCTIETSGDGIESGKAGAANALPPSEAASAKVVSEVKIFMLGLL